MYGSSKAVNWTNIYQCSAILARNDLWHIEACLLYNFQKKKKKMLAMNNVKKALDVRTGLL